MKKYKIVGMSISFFVIISLLLSYIKIDDNGAKKVERVSSLVSIDINRSKELLKDNKSFYFYIGRPTCPSCESLFPILEKVYTELNVELYYLNTDILRVENETEMNKLMERIEVNSVPLIIYFKNGIEVSRLEGLREQEELELYFNSKK